MPRRSNGGGSITRRQDSRWQASLQVNGTRRNVYGRTRGEAARKLDELKKQAIARGTLPDSGKRTVSDLLNAWLEVRSPNWKPTTLTDYRQTCDMCISHETQEYASLGAYRI